jgi:hypothetical protein
MMISIDRMIDEDFERQALAILQRELGLDGLAHFLRLNRAACGDYTRDRCRWLDGITIEEIMAEVESRPDAATWSRRPAPARQQRRVFWLLDQTIPL